MVKSSSALDRLLHSPQLATLVPRLAPMDLQRTIARIGLEECAEIVALATPAQIAGVLDIELWQARPGADDQFDPERFGDWLNVLVEAGAAIAADKLSAVDPDVIAAALCAHVAMFDAGAVSPYISLEGDLRGGRASTAVRTADIGGCVVEAARTDAWDAIVELLSWLADEQPDRFNGLMRRCVALSSSAREEDGFHALLQDREQHLSDIAGERQDRRDAAGFVAPADARAFLAGARTLALDTAMPPPNAVARAYFHALLGEAAAARPALVRASIETDTSAQETLAFLANALLAGCTLQGRAFTPKEASRAAAAVCSLGSLRWPAAWPRRDLITAFQVGWRTLYEEVCLFTARELCVVLKTIACRDREIQLRLVGLRRQLERAIDAGAPWQARDALGAILMLDAAAWTGVAGLVDECPVIHAVVRQRQSVRTIAAADFSFIADDEDLAAIRDFVRRLPQLLTR